MAVRDLLLLLWLPHASLSRGRYLRSFRGPIQFALMAADDPLPGLLDLPVFAYKNLCSSYKSLFHGLPLKGEGLKSKS